MKYQKQEITEGHSLAFGELDAAARASFSA
jgi:hypothetical protein